MEIVKLRQSYYLRNKDKISAEMNLKTKSHRLVIINHLGAKCIKCGFKDIRALQLDHINGDGSKEVKKMGAAITVYRYYAAHLELTKTHFQVLCANCNWIKRYENNEVRK